MPTAVVFVGKGGGGGISNPALTTWIVKQPPSWKHVWLSGVTEVIWLIFNHTVFVFFNQSIR